MAKFIFVVVVALLASTLVADAQRQRLNRQRTRTFARQEVADAEAVVTPYPSADELKPEVPFEEAGAAQTPDEVYGPPEPTANNIPDEVYGPPEVNENDLPAAEDAAAVADVAPVDEQQARLVAARRLASYRRRQAAYRQAQAVRSAKLRRPAAAVAVRRTA